MANPVHVEAIAMGTASVSVSAEKNRVAELLARTHADRMPDIIEVYRVRSGAHENDREEPVKLLEVCDDMASDRVLPVRFEPRGDVNFASIVMQVSVTTGSQILNGTLPLPNHWDVSSEDIIFRKSA